MLCKSTIQYAMNTTWYEETNKIICSFNIFDFYAKSIVN